MVRNLTPARHKQTAHAMPTMFIGEYILYSSKTKRPIPIHESMMKVW